MPKLRLLSTISIGVFLIPSIAYTYLPTSVPTPTLTQVIANLLGVIAPFGILAFVVAILFGIFYTLWKHWKKKPVKETIQIFLKIGVSIFILTATAFFIEWFLKSKEPAPEPYPQLPRLPQTDYLHSPELSPRLYPQ